MGRTFLKYGFITIGVYLVSVYATGAGKLIDSSTSGASNLVKAFQGR